eukprot:m.492566 g.492566  ORF g.492566 m.492566 type:complete len:154 (+) comp33142_c0_seq1:291-752(+)
MRCSRAVLCVAVVMAIICAEHLADALSRKQRARLRRQRRRQQRKGQQHGSNAAYRQQAPKMMYGARPSNVPANLGPGTQTALLQQSAKSCFDTATVDLASYNLRPTTCTATTTQGARCAFECITGSTDVSVTSLCTMFNGRPAHSVFNLQACS